MKIQLLNGGLANQVFQYIFARYGELSRPGDGKWFFDDSAYFVGKVHNGYELEKVFGIKANLLSTAMEPDVWREYIDLKAKGMSIPQIFADCGEDIIMYAETDDYKMTNPFKGRVYRMMPEGNFYPGVVGLNAANVYYHGNWVDANWFNGYKDVFRKELAFPELKGKQACTYMEQIKEKYSVAVHIRRGDYLGLGLALESNYYHEALSKLAEEKEDYRVFVFSDDLYWCNQHSGELGLHFAPEVVYVSGNYGAESYVDLQLMSMCDGLIMANSAFSYLAGLLNEHLDFVINPIVEKEDEE